MPSGYDFGKYYLELDKKINQHIQSANNPHRVTKAQVGLSEVENYSPANMPLSDAAIAEIERLDEKIDQPITTDKIEDNAVTYEKLSEDVQEKIGEIGDNVLTYTQTEPTEDNPKGIIFAILTAEPAHKYNGYIYIIDSESEPSYIDGNRIILGTESTVNGNRVIAGSDITIQNNRIILN